MSKKRRARIRLLLTHPVEWFTTRESSKQKREEEKRRNASDFLAKDDAEQNEMLDDAEWNMNVRYSTAQNSLVYSGLVFMGECTMFAELYGRVPIGVVRCFALSLVLLLIGAMPALSELFRRQLTEKELTRLRRGEEAAGSSAISPDLSRYGQLRVDRYTQIKQRTFHVQRNTYRLRWFTVLAAAVFAVGIVGLVI